MIVIEKNLINNLFHVAVIGSLVISYVISGQIILEGPVQNLDFTPLDVLDMSVATESKDVFIKQGHIPADIIKQARPPW